MTKWKEQINQELGIERKFQPELEQKILQKANSQKQPRNFRYPLTIAATFVVVLLMLLTWPSNSPVEKSQASFSTLNEMTQQSSPVSFYISDLKTNENRFLARANSLVMGVRKYSSKDAMQVMAPLLQNAQLAEQTDNRFAKDVVVKLSNGDQLKLKLFNSETYVGILDVQTNLYYKSEGTEAQNMLTMYFEPEGTSFTLKLAGSFFILSFIIPLLIRYKKIKLPLAKQAYIVCIIIVGLMLFAQFLNVIISLVGALLLLAIVAILQAYKLKEQGALKVIRRRQLILAGGLIFTSICLALYKMVGGVL